MTRSVRFFGSGPVRGVGFGVHRWRRTGWVERSSILVERAPEGVAEAPMRDSRRAVQEEHGA